MTTFLGIDLAWGEKQPTGLAVLDADARLLYLAAVRTDEEIGAALAPYLGPDCVAGIDAPLVVTNADRLAPGGAGAEPRLPQVRGRHPPLQHRQGRVRPRHPRRPGLRAARARDPPDRHRGLPACRDGRAVRAGQDAEVQGQARPRPRLPARRAAPADGPGRERRHAGRGLGDAAGRGRGGHSQERAPRGRGPGRRRRLCLRRAGTPTGIPTGSRRTATTETGIIVTPSLGLPVAAVRHDPAREAVRTYAEQHPDLVAAASAAVALLASILDEAGINYLTIEGRAKSVASFAEKATRTASGRAALRRPPRATSATSSASA